MRITIKMKIMNGKRGGEGVAETPRFDHEKLKVYQRSIESVAWSGPIVDRLSSTLAVMNQLDRASTLIPVNIADGNGKSTSKDRCRFFGIAGGSALESAACIDVAVARRALAPDTVSDGKEMLRATVAMLIGPIRSDAPERST